MKVVVVGAGMVGLCTGLLLAGDGHEVEMLERDAAPPPSPEDSWGVWERRGVNQFRLAHFFLSRFRMHAEEELPALTEALRAAGACRYNIIANIPDSMKGGSRPADERFDVITGRRCVVEAVAARLAEEADGVTVRRGAAVTALVLGAPASPGVPQVTGVRLDGGERIGADLVIDASGRRSSLPRLIADAGGAPVAEEIDDSGFVYYGRHFRSEDGSLPVLFGPLRQEYGSISALTLPADNGTWSVTLITSSKDHTLRRLSDADHWAAAVKLLPQAAHWIDAHPIDDRVTVMAKIEDRIRDFAPGGRPVVTGVLAVGDSWACTNPSLGRGVSMGLMHAVRLRQLLSQVGADDPFELASRWYEITRSEMEPWYRSTLNYDRHRLAQAEAIIEDKLFTSEDAEWLLQTSLQARALEHPDLLRSNLELQMLLRRADEILGDSAVTTRLEDEGGSAADQRSLGPSRAELVSAIT